MGKLVACTNLTLDGVMQSPADPEEDPRDGFAYGGWGAPYAAMTNVGQVFADSGAMLFGRRTYENFADVWPKRPDSPFTPWLSAIPKYVVSRTLDGPLPWVNSTLIAGDVPAAVAQLKRDVSKNILILGSGELIRSLLRDDLMDEFVLLVHPLVLGSGRRLFDEGTPRADLRLVDSAALPNGVTVLTYRPAR